MNTNKATPVQFPRQITVYLSSLGQIVYVLSPTWRSGTKKGGAAGMGRDWRGKGVVGWDRACSGGEVEGDGSLQVEYVIVCGFRFCYGRSSRRGNTWTLPPHQ